jgi:hypothetical protein
MSPLNKKLITQRKLSKRLITPRKLSKRLITDRKLRKTLIIPEYDDIQAMGSKIDHRLKLPNKNEINSLGSGLLYGKNKRRRRL